MNNTTDHEMAVYLRSQRRLTQAEVDRRAVKSAPKARYVTHDRQAPAAH